MDSHINNALEVIDIELAAIQEIRANLGTAFSGSVNLLINRIPPGKLIVMGMGKSGHIGKKIAASFASTGTPSFFVHPAEAGHGDLGMIDPKDVVLAISQSGRSHEFDTIISYLKRNDVSLVSLTGAKDSPLGHASDFVISTKISKEACPLGLAPTASSTASVVIGDALAMCCMKARGFDSNDYALTHPHGALGRKLLLKVEDIMVRGEDIPYFGAQLKIKDALLEISKKGLGFGIIVNDKMEIKGVFTDGDLRRTIDANINLQVVCVEKVMNTKFSRIKSDVLAVEAVNIMEKNKISALPVESKSGKLIGAINMRQIIQVGVI